MAHNEKLANRVREALAHLSKIEEKKMFRGITFMVNEKMFINVAEDEIMVRFDPAMHDKIIETKNCRPVIMKNREYKGFVWVSGNDIKNKKELDYWINLALAFNPKAKVSKKK